MKLLENIILAPYTVYNIGGPARFFIEAKGPEDLSEALNWAKEKNIPFFILGGGSNVLVSDKGFPGLVIKNVNGKIENKGEKLIVGSGVMMARAVTEAARAGLGGFEWGIGVPGTIGGSIRGNAGSFGGEMRDIIEEVSIFNFQVSKTEKLNNRQCEFGYRDSIFKKHPEWIILSAVLKLQKKDPEKIKERIREISQKRVESQDIGSKSCGCVFKNVSWNSKGINKKEILKKFPELGAFKSRENMPSAFLIDKSGLKGRKIGKVFISPKHANFFVNAGGATANEARKLIEITKRTVKEKYGMELQEEIQYVGF